jgi:hypothetical protein
MLEVAVTRISFPNPQRFCTAKKTCNGVPGLKGKAFVVSLVSLSGASLYCTRITYQQEKYQFKKTKQI